MIKSLALLAFAPYFSVSIGYKINEPKDMWMRGQPYNYEKRKNNISSVFELGAESKSNGVSFGLRHRSQPFIGAPFNDSAEYYVDEFFVTKKWSL